MIYHSYRKTMFYTANQILRDQHLAEDAVQTAFMKILKNIDKIDDDVESKRCKYFVVVITRNVAIDMYNKLYKNKIENIDDHYDIHDIDTVEKIIISEENYAELVDAVKEMPPIYQDTFSLKYEFDFSNKQISEILNIKVEAVRKRLQIIRSHLVKNVRSS